jgi:energy-coupling factor transporter ATP-binding protein EcfA2
MNKIKAFIMNEYILILIIKLYNLILQIHMIDFVRMNASEIISFIDNQNANKQRSMFLFIGNPKSGKSTFLNSLVGIPTPEYYKKSDYGSTGMRYRYNKDISMDLLELTSEFDNENSLMELFNDTSMVIIFLNDKKLNEKVCKYIKMIIEHKFNFIFTRLIDFNAEEHIETTNGIEVVYSHIRSGTNTPLLLKKMIEIANETRMIG